MKILHISLYPEQNSKHSDTAYSGVVSYTKNVISSTPYTKEDEVVVVSDKIGSEKISYTEDGVKVIRAYDKSKRIASQILSEVRKIRPDVVHLQYEIFIYGSVLNGLFMPFLLRLYTRLFLRKSRTVVTIHQVVSKAKINKTFVKENNSKLPIPFVKGAFTFIYKLINFSSDSIVVHETYFRNVLINEYRISPEKVYVVKHGVEDYKLLNRAKSREALNLPKEKDIVLFMGYLTGYKGLDLLIEGFAKYLKLNPNGYLVIGAGKHPKLYNDPEYLKEYTRIEKKAKRMLPKNSYCWHGFIKESEIQSYYSAADLFVSPYTISMSSSGPLAIAIGYGLPFICSEVFGHLIDNKDLLFNLNRISLAETMNRFFLNKKKYSTYSKELKNELLWSEVCKKYTNVIYPIFHDDYSAPEPIFVQNRSALTSAAELAH